MERYTMTSEIELAGLTPDERAISILARELEVLTQLLDDIGIGASVASAITALDAIGDNYYWAHVEAEVVLP